MNEEAAPVQNTRSKYESKISINEPLIFSWNNVSVNGYMVDPFWAKEVVPGRRCYTDISFSKDEFAKNDITSVEDIEYSMRVYNSDDWSDDSVFEETLTYNP